MPDQLLVLQNIGLGSPLNSTAAASLPLDLDTNIHVLRQLCYNPMSWNFLESPY